MATRRWRSASALSKLGPAYIKLGQVLSTRPDLLPARYIEELEHLQDNVPPMPYEVVEQTIEDELGARISKLFASFSEETLGSASLGQVHAAPPATRHDWISDCRRTWTLHGRDDPYQRPAQQAEEGQVVILG